MRLPGHRIVKTAVAVCVTAFICIWLHWPPVFAVITAIVTLEPTVKDSIQKGIIRFPASAIGSFYAVLFISFFGNTAITYTLAATLTIITCYRLNLHAGLLVATITSVAMIEVIHDNYMMAFFIRLGTTSIGLIVSTLVNMFIFPPNYQKIIEQNLQQIYKSIGHALQAYEHKTMMNEKISSIKNLIDKTKQFILYEVNEANYRPFIEKSDVEQKHFLETLVHIELIHYHLHNIAGISLEHTAFSSEQKRLVQTDMNELAIYFLEETSIDKITQMEELHQLMNSFWRSDHEQETFSSSLLPNELIILYETISIYTLLKENA
ncbi:FUSC family protein [Pseudogracilibacillus sp. ICA-222130]|uniref:FUSC family protein n=1 Tax=Pseudogracilibacillus sp. ICA-222130 TaxID=3134655 RepID=UPI0030C0294E